MDFSHHFVTTIDRSAADAWRDVTSLDGIMAELPWPLRLRTSPTVTTLDELRAATTPVVATLLLGPIPVLRWTPTIAMLDEAGRSFVEASSDMTWMRSWRHERRVAGGPDGSSTIEDRVGGSSSVPLAGWLVGGLFRARHRRLARGR